eukprot:GHRQ01028944.1.p1 GENE.GHRQ01028944.1~~GHRQ01028944.1.p1  ORF type:complete len:165 (-),score=25.25 GHRQ01028944.1:143-637(-)
MCSMCSSCSAAAQHTLRHHMTDISSTAAMCLAGIMYQLCPSCTSYVVPACVPVWQPFASPRACEQQNSGSAVLSFRECGYTCSRGAASRCHSHMPRVNCWFSQEGSPPFDDATAAAIIAADMRQPCVELFSWLSPTPVASASLGQVYQARLASTGAVVALKVRV